jgi:hypothetical protein
MKGSDMNPVQQSVNGIFQTTDLNLASFLRCCKFTVIDMQRIAGKTVFMFRDSADLRKSIIEFANDGTVPVRSFCNTVRDFKGLTGAGLM